MLATIAVSTFAVERLSELSGTATWRTVLKHQFTSWSSFICSKINITVDSNSPSEQDKKDKFRPPGVTPNRECPPPPWGAFCQITLTSCSTTNVMAIFRQGTLNGSVECGGMKKSFLHLVQHGGAWAGCGPTQSPPPCTKCNSPPVNGQWH